MSVKVRIDNKIKAGWQQSLASRTTKNMLKGMLISRIYQLISIPLFLEILTGLCQWNRPLDNWIVSPEPSP